MYLEFTQAFGNWKPGDISDDMHDNAAQGLIDAGMAKRSNVESFVRTANQSEMAKFRTEMTDMIGTILKGSRRAPMGPPTGGGELINQLRGESVPEEDQDLNRGFRDALKCIFHVEAKQTPEKLRTLAMKRLNKYLDSVTEYKEDAEGNEQIVTTRTLDDGSIEQIIRSGSDSLSGGQTYGFTLKPTYVSNLFEISQENEVFAMGTQPVPVTDGNEALWPGLQQFQAPTVLNGIPQAAVFGGVTLSRLGEETPRVSSDAKTFMNRFHVDDIAGLTDFSRDYITDSSTYIPMDEVVTRKFADAHAWVKDWEFINGDGVGKSQGFKNANAAITGGPNAGARENANKISSDDLMWMISHLHAQCRPDARFLANITTFTQLGILRDLNGNAVFQPNALIDQAMLQSAVRDGKVERGAMRASIAGQLLGFPVYFTEKLTTLGTTGDICLVCPYQYGDATKLRFEIGVSEHIFFLTDRIAYRTKARFTGRSLWPAPYTQADNPTAPGSGTQTSPFIVLHS